jgi:uncharacterized protein with HEPN domain
LVEASREVSWEEFADDETLKRACSIEGVGEATKNLSVEIRDRYPEVQWRPRRPQH